MSKLQRFGILPLENIHQPIIIHMSLSWISILLRRKFILSTTGFSKLSRLNICRPEPKARFIPSKDEIRMVGRMVHAIKMGWARGPKPKKETKKVYDLWASEDGLDHKSKSELARMRVHMPAPKVGTLFFF